MIEHLNRQIKNKINKTKGNPQTKQKQKWAIFEYHNPVIHKITNIFKNTDLHVSFQVQNTTQYILRETKPKTTIYEKVKGKSFNKVISDKLIFVHLLVNDNQLHRMIQNSPSLGFFTVA
jgi:5'(3')-deoxyribonucleotidase